MAPAAVGDGNGSAAVSDIETYGCLQQNHKVFHLVSGKGTVFHLSFSVR